MQDDVQDDRWALVEEGIELLTIGEVDQALDELSGVVEEYPDNEYAQFFLGQAYFEKQRYPNALTCYVRALELAPRYLGAIVSAGQTLRMMGEHERAIRMGTEALRIQQDDGDALYLLGAVHFQRGENKLAYGFLQRFLETGPELEVALEVEGMMQVIRGEVMPALDDDDADD